MSSRRCCSSAFDRRTVGEPSVIRQIDLPAWSSAIERLRCPIRSEFLASYLYYALRLHAKVDTSSDSRAQHDGSSSTAICAIVAQLPIVLPPLDEQRAIAHILGTLDDKIELNRRMNETLEAMARALFKSWFVDFDPVRAKAEGRDPGLPKPLADLFPGFLRGLGAGGDSEGVEGGTLGDWRASRTGRCSPRRYRTEQTADIPLSTCRGARIALTDSEVDGLESNKIAPNEENCSLGSCDRTSMRSASLR